MVENNATNHDSEPAGRTRRTALPHGLSRGRIAGIACLLLLVTTLSVSSWRHGLLRAAGWLLVTSDPSGTADVIVVAADAGREGVLDASDLVRAGVAARVAVFSEPLHAADRELIKRGLPYFNPTSVAIQQLHALGVTAIEQIPATVAGTEDEVRQLPPWCLSRGFHTVIFVSAPDHSHRLHRALARASRDLALRVLVHPSRYSDFDPDAWWLTRTGARIELIELQKLALDVLRHPLS